MATRSPTRTLRPEKRQAILRAARTVFASLGFRGATMDAIAKEADVSTRTIYKHFRNKDELFVTVLEASAAAVADDYEASVRAGIDASQSAHERLMAIARAATKQALGHPEHFVMIRQISSETAHLPAGALETWRAAGPDRVERETILQLRALHQEGVLDIDDFRVAARHFIALTTAETNARLGRKPLSQRAIQHVVTTGVEVFMRGYAPRDKPSSSRAPERRDGLGRGEVEQ